MNLLSELAMPQVDIVVVLLQVLVILHDFQVLIFGVTDCDRIRQPIRLERLFVLRLSHTLVRLDNVFGIIRC